MSDIDTSSVEQNLDELLGTLEDTLKGAKEATDRVKQLQEESARKDRIILEKIASAEALTKSASAREADIKALVDTMVEAGLSKQADAAKLSQQMIQDPGAVIKVAQHLATFSMPAPNKGQGIAKQAAHTEHSDPDPDGWGNVIRGGSQ